MNLTFKSKPNCGAQKDLSNHMNLNPLADKKSTNNFYQVETFNSNLFIGIVGKQNNLIDYQNPLSTVRVQEKKLLASLIGLSQERIIFLEQEHHDKIWLIESKPKENQLFLGKGDALISSCPEICLVIRTADCLPVFIYDFEKKILGAIHSGWRGICKQVVPKTINKMKNHFNSKIKDLKIFILPFIGPKAYEIKKEVAQYFSSQFIKKESNSLFLDLGASLKEDLKKEGVSPSNIFQTKKCTFHDNNEFFSHRKADAGRNLNFGFLTKG